MAFAEDVSAFFADFGASASIDGAVPVPVLFSEAYASPIGIGSVQPSLLVSTADWLASGGVDDVMVTVDPAAAPGGPLCLQPRCFRVRDPQAEGAFTRLMLESVL